MSVREIEKELKSRQDIKMSNADSVLVERNLLLACTGSVATIKLPIIGDKLKAVFAEDKAIKLNVRVVVTEHAKHFYDAKELSNLTEIFTDDMEWSSWKNRGDPVLHIDLAKWADVMLIAPLDANTLAKISQGICDNLLTCIARAWVFQKPLIFCPAMNTKMWEHPITAKQIAVLKEWCFIEIPCIVKNLMCGDTGLGAMAEVDTIVKKTEEILRDVTKQNS